MSESESESERERAKIFPDPLQLFICRSKVGPSVVREPKTDFSQCEILDSSENFPIIMA